MSSWIPTPPEDPYHTLVIWHGTVVQKDDDIEDFFMETCNSRIKRVGCVTCLNGRIDFAFFVHDDDVTKFAVQRFKLGNDTPRWWEDIYFNDQQDQFPDEFLKCYPNV